MPNSDDDRRRRKKREEQEKKQRQTEKRGSKMDDRFAGTSGEYKKERRGKYGIESSTAFVSDEARDRTRDYQRKDREADRLDEIREDRRQEEVNRVHHRSDRRSEGKGGLDREGHRRVGPITERIVDLGVQTASARRTSLYDRDDPRHESYELPNMSSRNLHGRHAESAQKEARSGLNVADDHHRYGRESSTPSSREVYDKIANDGHSSRVALQPSRDSRDRPESRHTSYSSPQAAQAVDPRSRDSMTSSSNRDPRVNLAQPRRDYQSFTPKDQRPETSLSTSMSGGSGQRHTRNPASWKPVHRDDVSDVARRVAVMEMSDSGDDRDDRLRRARKGKKRRED